MTRPHYTYGPRTPSDPFGDIGYEAGDHAIEMLDHLSVPLETSQIERSEKPDYLALGHLSTMEWLRPLIVPEHPCAIGEVQGILGRQWTTLHTALPFSEGERVWFLNIWYSNRAFEHEMPDVMSQQEGEIVSRGLHKRVSGRNLMHRWHEWRREAGAYADQGTLDLARDALAELAGLLAPRDALPESYTGLRGPQSDT
jgi:hypothetical protein